MTEVLSASPSHIMYDTTNDDSPLESSGSSQPRHSASGATMASPTPTKAAKRTSTASRDSRPSTKSQSRLSTTSQQTFRNSRPNSTTPTLNLQSSLPYAHVRDFAYPAFHPMHFGGPPSPSPTSSSGPQSATSEHSNTSRRLSDSAEGSAGRGQWSAGPWGGDGVMYEDMAPLPSTSFGHASGTEGQAGDEWAEDEYTHRKNKHRKSRSFADMPNYERGRRRESAGKKEAEGHHGASDPAGRDALRQSRGFHQSSGSSPRRDSHLHNNASQNSATLPSRSFHTSQLNVLSDLPLDAETPISPITSPMRASLCPDDETLYAGPSLALYNFEPENDNELRLVEGQTILVSYRHGQGWLVAENPKTGEQGLVPEEYVRLLRDIEGWDWEKGGWIDEEDDGEEDEEDSGEGDLDPSEGHGKTTGIGKEVEEKARELKLGSDKAGKR
ncbi:unnamed protein product [Zymoseptoria tritici ST99CH_1A5]|uniref:SH3 domain-containing protein n=1 Tax=Zymoseptoria tritici ST99CH_1A5 TaxID=1276529 RepID=A0A1Y6L2I0_ZYMTR|nr:unnamed protein product [Zymoseptoria tritici ST99CH_1A5]